MNKEEWFIFISIITKKIPNLRAALKIIEDVKWLSLYRQKSQYIINFWWLKTQELCSLNFFF